MNREPVTWLIVRCMNKYLGVVHSCLLAGEVVVLEDVDMMSSARTDQRSNIEQRILVNARSADRVVCFARLKERLPGPQLRLCVYNDGGRHTRRFGGSQA